MQTALAGCASPRFGLARARGGFFWPRIGHEVVVVFEEGDPDKPMIVGSVYNANNMPPFTLPLRRNQIGGIKSGQPEEWLLKENFNGIVFFDEKGHEHTSIHSERHMTLHAEFDTRMKVGRHRGERIPWRVHVDRGPDAGRS